MKVAKWFADKYPQVVKTLKQWEKEKNEKT